MNELTSKPAPPFLCSCPVGQAALSGYSDWAMRVIAARLGAGFTLSEAMLDQFVIQAVRGRKGKRLLRHTDEERPCGGQLMGTEPGELAAAAEILIDLGFDWIDLNFACPVRKVLGRGRGGNLLSDPARALRIIAAVRKAIEAPLTVKLRRAYDDTEEARDAFDRIFDGAIELGTDGVTVHGRTVKQAYRGASSWDFLAEVKDRAGSFCVLGSGDLFDAESCVRMMRETGVDGVTVARGAIGNPWIFAQARALLEGKPLPLFPTVPEQGRVIAEHYRLAGELYDEGRCERQMRKFGIQYARLHPEAEAVKAAFIGVTRPGQWRDVLREWYNAD